LLLFFHANEKRDVHLYGMKLKTVKRGQGQTAKMMGGGGEWERPYVLHCFQPALQPTAKKCTCIADNYWLTFIKWFLSCSFYLVSSWNCFDLYF
jgi:hypothetical protein